MKKEAIATCPVCSGDLMVTRLTCSKCDTNIEGEFLPSKFQKLQKEDLEFLEIFIKNRGNIKAVEKEMKISYPTVKNKLENAIEQLGYKKQAVAPLSSVDILKKVNDGELTPEQAALIISGDEHY